jgi:hypothetical protein
MAESGPIHWQELRSTANIILRVITSSGRKFLYEILPYWLQSCHRQWLRLHWKCAGKNVSCPRIEQALHLLRVRTEFENSMCSIHTLTGLVDYIWTYPVPTSRLFLNGIFSKILKLSRQKQQWVHNRPFTISMADPWSQEWVRGMAVINYNETDGKWQQAGEY